MSIGLLFWILMVLWFFSWLGSTWAAERWPWGIYANNLLFFVLLFLLGWHSFGFVIHD
jgi:hypothetical protein